MNDECETKKDISTSVTVVAYLFEYVFDLCDFLKWFLKLNKKTHLFFSLSNSQFVGFIDSTFIVAYNIWLSVGMQASHRKTMKHHFTVSFNRPLNERNKCECNSICDDKWCFCVVKLSKFQIMTFPSWMYKMNWVQSKHLPNALETESTLMIHNRDNINQ